MNIDKYDFELITKIQEIKGYEDIDIWSRFNNRLESFWGRNQKGIIKIETLMSIPKINYYGEPYEGNFRFEITPEQAEDMIKTLQKILKNRR